MDPSPHATVRANVLPEADTLTFLFTDVEGSTPLWERHEATMRAVTARHDILLDSIVSAYGGQRVRERGEGDSLFVVFGQPQDAVAAALAMARAVQQEQWPQETPIRVRLGLHTGSAQLRAGDYYGPVVNRCARIRGLGHGGQVLLSATTAALVHDALPAEASLRALGAHSLKGLSAPEEVYQLCHPDLPADFPPLLSPQAPRHNLPQTLTPLIGREAEQGEVLALLGQARLVTLTGSGGVGKTRLALAVASELVDQYEDGVWLVELDSLAEPGLVPSALARVLDVREEPGRPLMSTLIDHLKDRHTLLVLDNSEHLVAACADLVTALLRACPRLCILATSREGLEIAGERRLRVPSLTVPDLKHLPPVEQAGNYEAVRLFVARARERRADFALTTQNARVVAQICARLDGIPLALELASARVPTLGVEGIAARLDDRFRLLTSGTRDALPRQRTLRATLEWSYDLLTTQEQVLLDRLSVFAGGCVLPAIEAVCVGEGVEDWEILDLMGGLVNKSLVQAEESERGENAGGELRYGLLETVRQYGLERLRITGAGEAPRDRHLSHYLALAEEAEPQLTGPEQSAWLQRLVVEHDNLRAALQRAIDTQQVIVSLRLAGALWRFWAAHGYLSEGRSWLDRALNIPMEGQSQGPDETRTRFMALYGAAMLAQEQADVPQAIVLADQCLSQARTGGDRQQLARALLAQGLLARMQGDSGRAIACHQEALALARQTTDRLLTAEVLMALGDDYGFIGDQAHGESLVTEALALFRQIGDKMQIADMLSSQAFVVSMHGDHARAEAMARDSVALFRELNDTGRLAESLWVLGISVMFQGAHVRARTFLEESLALRRQRGDRRGAGYSLAALGFVALMEGDLDRTVLLGEEGLTLMRESGDLLQQGNALAILGNVALWRGQGERGVEMLRESLTIYQEMGTGLLLPWSIEGMALVAAAQGDMASAVRLYGATMAVAQAQGFAMVPLNHAAHDHTLAMAQRHLGNDACATTQAEGQTVTIGEAIAMALAVATSG